MKAQLQGQLRQKKSTAPHSAQTAAGLRVDTIPPEPMTAGRSGCACGGICPRCISAATSEGALRISQPHEPHERQADQVADRILQASPRTLSTESAAATSARVPAGVIASAPAEVRETLATPGRALDDGIRTDMEGRFGLGFSHVRIHVGDSAARSAQSLGARAYTLGNHIVFNEGEYRISSREGQRLLAHELVHVVQQTGPIASNGRAESLGGQIGWQPLTIHPMIQRDIAVERRRPGVAARVLTPAQITAAINYNNRMLGSIPNSTEIIRRIRDEIGVSALPAVVDADFVNGVVRWQASFRLRQDGWLGPTTARPLFRNIGAQGTGRGRVRSGPRYRPRGGPLPVAPAGGFAKSAHFAIEADFDSDPANGIFPSCCEVRQYIQWDAAAATSFNAIWGGVRQSPHAGFPANWPAGRWIEDRNAANNMRYGRRSGRWNNPRTWNNYLDAAGRRNQAFGHRFRGSDTPGGPAALAGRWRFLVKVVDVCNNNADIGGIDRVFINW